MDNKKIERIEKRRYTKKSALNTDLDEMLGVDYETKLSFWEGICYSEMKKHFARGVTFKDSVEAWKYAYRVTTEAMWTTVFVTIFYFLFLIMGVYLGIMAVV